MASRHVAGIVGAALALVACRHPMPATEQPPLIAVDAAVDAAVVTPPAPPPTLRLPTTVAPTAYQLTLGIDPARPSFDGAVVIDLALAEPTDVVWLHADALTLDRVTIDAADGPRAVTLVPDAASQHVGLWVTPPLPAGAARATLAYRGEIVDDEPMGLFAQRDGAHRYVYSQMEGVFARRVVPCFDEPQWKVPWQVTVRAPAGFTVLGNMPERARRTVDAGVEIELAPTPPMASYLLAVAVGSFEAVDIGPVGRDAVPARVLTPAGRSAAAAAAAAVTPVLVDRLEAYFDRPLPLAKLDLLAVPQFFGAMENPGLITFTSSTLLIDPARPSAVAQRDLRGVVAHELAHQWFGDLVTPRWWDDLWLNESFATWMAAGIARKLDPRAARLTADRASMERAMAADALPSARPLRRPIEGGLDVDDSFDAIAYEKGGALLAMFERQLGAERLRAGVRGYIATHAGGNASAADFLAALAAATEPEVAAAFASFLDHPGVPEVAVTLTCAAGTDATVAATVTSARGDAPWTLPICVRFPDRGATWSERCAWLPPGGGAVTVPRCPAWVTVNPDGAGYYRVAYAPALDAALRTHLRDLAVADRFTRAADLAAQVRAGHADVATLLAWQAALVATGDRHDLLAAVALAEVVAEHVAPADRPRWQRFIRARFGAVARKLGVLPRRGDSPTVLAARARVRALVVEDGADPTLGRAVVAAVDAWLAGGADPGDDRGELLRLAAIVAPAGLRDRLILRLRATDDRDLREELIDALAAQHDAAARADNRAEFFDDESDPLTALPLVVDALGTDDDAGAWTELTADFDRVAARLMPLDRAELVARAGLRCSPTSAAEVEAFFRPRAEDDPHRLRRRLASAPPGRAGAVPRRGPPVPGRR